MPETAIRLDGGGDSGRDLRTTMKTVAAFSTPAEAHVVLTRLHSAGIAAVIRDEMTVTFDWFMSNAIGGVKIEVPEEDVDAALEILQLPPSEEAVLRCPHCGSSDTSVRVLNAFGAFCLIFKLPIPMTRAVVDCRSCGKSHDTALRGKPPVPIAPPDSRPES